MKYWDEVSTPKLRSRTPIARKFHERFGSWDFCAKPSLSLKDRFPFFEERADAFLVVVTVVNFASHPLDTLEDLGGEWLSLGQNVNLFFQQSNNQRRVGQHVLR